MKISVSHIPPDGLVQEYSAKAELFPILDDLIIQGDYVFSSPVQAHLTAMVLANEVVDVNGQITTTLRMDCGRCLEPFEHTLIRKFKMGFVKSSGTDTAPDEDELDIEIREEDIATEYYLGDVIDLKNMIQEQVVMGLPQHPLCSDNCKGLCQSCGNNLNLSPCSCSPTIGHPAFAVLKGLKT
ncbi:MAG: DUF177 domain-containing protein [Proteobacteria bacterium]|nr:DUF177 domain-containing protein [Pseudomonadota bacterium]